MAAEGIHRREGSKVFHQNLLGPLGMGANCEERPQHVVCYRTWDNAERLYIEVRGRVKSCS